VSKDSFISRVIADIIDGYHRLNVNPKWPRKKVEEVRDPVQLAIARLIANVCRRTVSAEEKTEWLRQIAELTGWTPRQIAENLPVSYTWVMKYLPDEYKTKTWEQEKPITRRVISCARCGDAVSMPVHLKGQFYCESCARKIELEEKGQSHIPVVFPEVTAGPGPGGFEPAKGPEPEEPGATGDTSKPRPEEIDTGFEWECPECHRKFQLIHVNYPDGKVKHKLEPYVA